MLRSMYSGISGMKNFQIKLDVIGNNIANVNTFGFKKGRTTFKDLVSQQLSGATGPTGQQGGVNPRQVGLGSQLATIDTIHTQGSIQTTGRPLDLSISGDGFFVVGKANGGIWAATPPVANADVNQLDLNYTRAGNFYFDREGFIVNGDGLYLIGKTSPNPDTGSETVAALTNNGRIKVPTNAQSFSIGADGTVNFIDKDGQLRVAGQVSLATFPNPEGLTKVGANLYSQSPNSGNVGGQGAPLVWNHFSAPGADGSGSLVSSSLEMSNVDLSEEFTEMIVAQRGFQANTRIITTSDEILQELVNLKR